MRWLAAVVGAVAVHGAVLLLVRAPGSPGPRPPALSTAISITLRPAERAPLPPPEGPKPPGPPEDPKLQRPRSPPPRAPQTPRSEPPPLQPAPRGAPPAPSPAPRSEPQPPSSPSPAPRSEPQPPSAPPPAPPSEPPSPSRRAAGAPAPVSGASPLDLFPRAVLERQAGAGAAPGGRTVNAANRAALEAAGAAADARAVRERVRLAVAEEKARADTAQGRVAPVWREAERRLALDFSPPTAVVYDEPEGVARKLAGRLGSLSRQALAMWRRGEDGLRRPVVPGTLGEAGPGRSIDPGQQSWLGTPEGLNLRAAPLEQQAAALAAQSEPAEWLTVEIEVESAAGQLRAARVALPSGRRAFDRFALGEVRRHVAAARLPEEPSVSRWRCAAGYFVKDLSSITGTFDEMMIFDRKLRQKASIDYPLKSGVRSRVSLLFVRPAQGDP